MRPRLFKLASPPSSPTSGARGFSLIEVMVSLIAGLIVALGVIGVSHEATNTLHEEVRIASAENGLRVAIERLRADLQRAGFMSTANIYGDPLIARRAPAGDNLSNLVGGSAAAPLVMKNLAGIRLYSQGAAATPLPPTTYQLPAGTVMPDAIDIGGNFTTTDEFAAFSCGGPSLPGAPAPPPVVPNPCGGPVMCLEMNTPAMWRILNQPTPGAPTAGAALAALQAAFQPGGVSLAQYMARITDASGHYQYVMTCATGGGATVIGGSSVLGFQVNLAAISQVLVPKDTGGQGGVGGISAGLVVISPLQVARWDLVPASTLPANYLFGALAVADPNEFVLTRGFLDLTTGLVDPFTLEVVAEYGVDLKFGFTVDQSNASVVTPPGTFGANPLYAYSVDDSLHNAGWAALGTGAAAGGVWGNSTAPNTTWVPATGVGLQGVPEPQRIRSVRARIGIRSPFADRAVDITPPTASGNYMYRYQLLPAVSTNALKFARVRESITEVTLSNQARYFW